jgi:DNA-binding transcriptional ArsR family regulator
MNRFDGLLLFRYFDLYRIMEIVMNASAVIKALGALAQEHRLAAFRLLVQAGEEGMPAGAIGEKLGVVSSSMSFHLAALANAGLVAQRRQSRLIIYTANYPAMNALMGYLTENCCGGVPCTDEVRCCSAPSSITEESAA